MSMLSIPSKQFFNVRFSPNNDSLLALTAVEVQGLNLNGSLHLMEFTPQLTLKQILQFDYPGCLFDLEWCDINAYPSLVLTGAGDGKLQIWNVFAPKSAPILLGGHASEIHTIHWSQSTNRALSGSTDCTIRLWDLDQKETIRGFAYNEAIIHHVEFHPNLPNLFASVSGDYDLNIWDNLCPFPVSSLRVHSYGANSCNWSKFDDNMLATGGGDGIIRGWDRRWLPYPNFELGPVHSPLRKIMFSPFSFGSLASVDYGGMTRMWNQFDCQYPMMNFKGHNGFTSGLDWNSLESSPHLRLLTDCGWDGVVRVYNPAPVLQWE